MIGPKTKATAAGTTAVTVLTLAIAFAEEIKGIFIEMGGGQDVQELAAKHDHDIAQLMPEIQMAAKFAKETYSNGLPDRIKNLLRLECHNPELYAADPSRDQLKNRLLNDYQILNNRSFNIGTCNDEGEYCNAMGVCSAYNP